ncbi:hypothetical protein ACTG9Q_22210 [Actinokineospora sp. 24-640]
MAVPLERKPQASEQLTLSTARLMDCITLEIEQLRTARPLSPSARLRRLVSEDIVVIGSDELIERVDDDETTPYIESSVHRPYSHISRDRALALRDEPIEWARHYRKFTVETWDRELILSVYLHLAMHESALYIEWTPCVLLPIDTEFRKIDSVEYTPFRGIVAAIGDLLTFPADLFGNIVRLFALPEVLRDGVTSNPDRFGALHSLREFAATPVVTNYFQRLDIDRYLKIMHTQALRAVSTMLSDAGFLVAALEQQVQAIVQNNVHIDGSMTGSLTMGQSNKIGNIEVKKSG